MREAALSAELGLSRTPVRESLLLLHADGLVELTPNRGARIATYTREDLEDAYHLRATIEAYAARRAAERISPRDVEALRRSCFQFDQLLADQSGQGGPGDLAPLIQENFAFHSLVQRASGSRRVPALIRGLIHLPLLYQAGTWYSPNRKVISKHHHHDITEALAHRDADADANLMREHVLEAGNAGLEAMDRASSHAPATPSPPPTRL